MKVNYIIVHHLVKEVTKTKAELDLSTEVLDMDDKAKDLVEELNKRYGSLRNIYATFDDDTENHFPLVFNTYSKNQSKESFIDFSQKSAQNLRERIEGIAPAKGGYLVFTDYEEHSRFVGVFLIRNVKGKLFVKDIPNKKFKIDTPEHIDLEKMAMACRINKSFFESSQGRYLSFIKRANEEMSDYFINWISAKDTEDNKQDTEHLRTIIQNIKPPIKDDGVEMTTSEFLQASNSFIRNCPDKTVDLRMIGKTFYNDDDILIEYASKNHIPINSEFKADSDVLRKFISVKAKGDSISLEFPQKYWRTEVTVNNDHSKVIINSSRLAQNILDEMNNNDEN